MDEAAKTAAGSADRIFPCWIWLLGVVLLLSWQGWLTLQLFGAQPWQNLLNDQPLSSGGHCPNYYIGLQRAQAITEHGRTSSFDENYYALYPVTPIFDGSRLAQLFLLLGGGADRPAAYKLGVAGLCMLVPILLMLTCMAIGLGRSATLLATFLGQLIWWGPHGSNALHNGDCELYMASLAVLAHVGLLVAFDRTAGVWAWFGLCMTGCLSWFLQPLLLPIALPILLAYYVSVGEDHDFLSWHIFFWTAEAIGLLLNLPWLVDWLDSWWLRTELPTAAGFLPHRTMATIWNAPLWEGSTERLLAMILLGSAAVGLAILNQTGQRTSARVLGLGAAGALILALLGIAWEPLGAVGTSALLAPALWFTCIPAAYSWVWVGQRLWRGGRWGRGALAFLALNSTAGLLLFSDITCDWLGRCLHVEPLAIGLGPDRQNLVRTLKESTTSDARILWEDRDRPRRASRWSALLPLLTGRQFIGGLDPDGVIEHSSMSLMHQSLEGRPIATWTDKELHAYCRRYNICWVVAWSPAVIQRFGDWEDAEKWKQVHDEGTGWLFRIRRTPNFALKGHAELLHADGQQITLGNVEPDNGEVIISLHYLAGLRASLDRVRVERAHISDDDHIGFVRLRLAVYAFRVTLSCDR